MKWVFRMFPVFPSSQPSKRFDKHGEGPSHHHCSLHPDHTSHTSKRLAFCFKWRGIYWWWEVRDNEHRGIHFHVCIFFCYLLLSFFTTLHTPQHHTPQPLLLLLHLHHTHFRHPPTHTHERRPPPSPTILYRTPHHPPTTFKQQDTITKVNTRTATSLSSLSPQKII